MSERSFARKNGNKNTRSEGIGLASVCSVCQSRRLAAKRPVTRRMHSKKGQRQAGRDEQTRGRSKDRESSIAQRSERCKQRQRRQHWPDRINTRTSTQSNRLPLLFVELRACCLPCLPKSAQGSFSVLIGRLERPLSFVHSTWYLLHTYTTNSSE